MWTLGTLIALPMAIIAAIACISIGVYLARRENDDPYHGDDIFAIIWTAVGAFLIVITAWAMYPYKADYHRWNTKDGVVTNVEKRLVGTGNGMEEKIVVKIDGHEDPYGCLDTRCALLVPGDYLKLACKKVFEYGATDGWDCKFREWDDRTPA